MDRDMRQHSCQNIGAFGRLGALGLTGLGLSLLLVGACDSGEPRDPEPRRGEGEIVAADASSAEESPAPMAAPEGAGESEPREASPRREGEEARAFLETVEPVATRAGHLRFTAEEIADPQATAIFAARLAAPSSPPELRLALAEALHRSGGDWPAAILAQLAVEEDPKVRGILVSTLAKAPEAAALVGLQRGLVDPAAEVRRAACELAGWAPAAGRDSSVAAPLRAALADDDARIRAAAARAFGLMGEGDHFDAVMSGLADGDAEVRLQTLRALERLDPARAAALPEVASLAAEGSDPRVKRAATKLRAETGAGR